MTTGQDQILSAVREALGAHLTAASHVCVALSGGMDSVVLLHAMARLRTETSFQLSALHVNHGLSPNAEDWAAFCQNLCVSLQIPCHVVRLQLPKPTGKGVEQVAREARYKAFAATPGDILCLAHHENDRAETLLLNLFRGAGTTGLAGVPNARPLGDKVLLRPFMKLQRSELQAWANAHQLQWIEDESNENLVFRRNYVRHRVLPVVAEAFPGVVGVLARTSSHMAEQCALLDRLAGLDAEPCRDAGGQLSVARLQKLPEAAVRNILRVALNQSGVRIPAAKRLEAFSSQLMRATPDTATFVRMGDAGVHIWRDQIWVDLAMAQALPDPYSAQTGAVAWPDGTLRIDNINASAQDLHVAPLGHGQRFQPVGRCRDRVSELLRAQGVPPWVRSRLPAVWHDKTLFWVAELGLSESAIGEKQWDLNGLHWQPKLLSVL